MYRAVIERVEGETLEILSSLPIVAKLFDHGWIMLFGEFDTVAVPFEEIRHFRIYEQGVTVQ